MHESMHPMTLPHRAFWLLGLAMAAALAVYWPGLSGPFLFDDYSNIEAVNDWLAGEQGLTMTLLPNASSVVYSRPVSMASFVLSAWLGGSDPFAYKFGNLLVHLACGALIFVVLRRVLSEDRTLSVQARTGAAFLAAVWLLHPLHASTVLYVVQRMAQLSTLFTLLAVAVYLVGRRRLIAGQARSAAGLLFVAFPLLLITGLLSKQNAAIAPFLCVVLEVAYFGAQRESRRMVLAFFGTFTLVPAIAVFALLLIAPQSLLAGYGDWDFTLGQRLLTQPRALLDYIGLTVLPDGPRMGIYTDDFPVSTGLFDPPATLFALGVLIAITVTAIALRRRAPSVFAGWGFFLVAHGVESSFLPLEMYYEHRNYLPSAGLLLALAGLLGLISTRLPHERKRLRRIGVVAALSLLAVLAFATLGRALVWQTEEAIVSQAVRQHPGSMRAMLDQGVIHIKRQEYDEAVAVTAPLRNSDVRRQRVIGYLQRVAVQCMQGQDIDTAGMQRAVDQALPKVTVFELQMARLIVLATPTGQCGDHSTRFLAEGVESLLDAAAGQTGAYPTQNAMRVAVAQLYARAGDWQEAESQAAFAWASRTYLPAGALLTRIYVHNGKHAEALLAIRQLESEVRPFDTVSRDQVAILRALVADPNSTGTEAINAN